MELIIKRRCGLATRLLQEGIALAREKVRCKTPDRWCPDLRPWLV